MYIVQKDVLESISIDGHRPYTANHKTSSSSSSMATTIK